MKIVPKAKDNLHMNKLLITLIGMVLIGAVALFLPIIYAMIVHSGNPKSTSHSLNYTNMATVPNKVIDSTRGFIGSPNAPVTLVEFGDYECPPCRASHPFVHKLLNRYPDTIRFQFRNLPLTGLHPLAMPAAQIAEQAQRSHNFEAVHDVLFGSQADLDESVLSRARKMVVTNKEAVTRAKKSVDADVETAKNLEIDSTPTFLLCLPDQRVLKLSSLQDVPGLIARPQTRN